VNGCRPLLHAHGSTCYPGSVDATLVAVVAIALFFDFTNGFHDAANAIATSVSTRALTPRLAVAFAGLLNFVGALISIKVATTVGSGIVHPEAVTLKVVLAGISGAVTWNLLTWYAALPTSSSHALIGGVLGAAIAASGFNVVQWRGLSEKVLIPSILSPVFGVVLAAAAVIAIVWLVYRQRPGVVTSNFRRMQVLSAGFVALAHGTNDAQKTMGVIALALVAGHPREQFHVPAWVILSAAAAMAAGTYSGGWRIIRTVGQRIVKLEPYQGFAAETATAAILYTTAQLGFPVSTTHTITGSVMGAGGIRRASAVRWGIAQSIIAAWLMTIPCAGIVAGLMERVTRLPEGSAILFSLTVVIIAVITGLRSRRDQRASSHPYASPAQTRAP
jgi:PiT family inorganic phosphate transporter